MAAKERKGSAYYELEKPVHVVAIAQGYYRNRVLNQGQRFRYDSEVKKDRDGKPKLPHWMELDKSVPDNELVLKGSKPAQKSKPSNKDAVKDLV